MRISQVYCVLLIITAAMLLQPGNSVFFSISNMRISQVYCVLLIITSAATLLHSGNSARNCRYRAIFNFGDSNSDTGGLSAAIGAIPPPNGETFFHHPAGRASDGRLIIDFIAERLGFPKLSAYLDSIGADYSHGVNFATGGSTILEANTTFSQGGPSPISLNVQSRQFSQFITRSQFVKNQDGRFKHLLPNEDTFSRALYTFDIGQNDLAEGYKMNLSTDQVKAFVPDLVRQLSDVIKKVYAKGGRRFWIHNSGPLGCLPYTLVKFPVNAAEIDENGCSKPHNDASRFYNLKLKQMVDELQGVHPLASFTYVDIYSLKYSLIRDAKKLGFHDPFLVCCGRGGRYNLDISWKWRCGVAKSCKKPESRISWDGIHYTEAANKWIFDRIVNDLC